MKAVERIGAVCKRQDLSGEQLVTMARGLIGDHLSPVNSRAGPDGLVAEMSFDTVGWLEALADALERDRP